MYSFRTQSTVKIINRLLNIIQCTRHLIRMTCIFHIYWMSMSTRYWPTPCFLLQEADTHAISRFLCPPTSHWIPPIWFQAEVENAVRYLFLWCSSEVFPWEGSVPSLSLFPSWKPYLDTSFPANFCSLFPSELMEVHLGAASTSHMETALCSLYVPLFPF